MNVKDLREALDDWVQEYVWLLQQHAPKVPLEPLEDITEAARAVLNAEEWSVCSVHKSRWFTHDQCEYAYLKDYDGPPNECEMVPARLLIGDTE